MSRITIDLRKRAKERVRYDLSRYVVEDEYGPHCYQLSQFHFRDILTGGKSMPRNTGIPASTMGNTDTTAATTTVVGTSEEGSHR